MMLVKETTSLFKINKKESKIQENWQKNSQDIYNKRILTNIHIIEHFIEYQFLMAISLPNSTEIKKRI